MQKFIPFEKLSKKKQKEINAKNRGRWYGINPVTRKPANPHKHWVFNKIEYQSF